MRGVAGIGIGNFQLNLASLSLGQSKTELVQLFDWLRGWENQLKVVENWLKTFFRLGGGENHADARKKLFLKQQKLSENIVQKTIVAPAITQLLRAIYVLWLTRSSICLPDSHSWAGRTNKQ